MITYTKSINHKGTPRYRITDDTKIPKSRFISPEKVPPLERQRLDAPDSGNGQSPQALPVSKDCIFCGLPGNRQKFLEGQRVRLCEEDWLTKTTGEVVAQLRKG